MLDLGFFTTLARTMTRVSSDGEAQANYSLLLAIQDKGWKNLSKSIKGGLLCFDSYVLQGRAAAPVDGAYRLEVPPEAATHTLLLAITPTDIEFLLFSKTYEPLTIRVGSLQYDEARRCWLEFR